MQTVYKVVRVADGKRYSVYTPSQYVVEYCPNEWVVPEIGKVFACPDEEAAFELLEGTILEITEWHQVDGYEIWRCEAEGVVPIIFVPSIATVESLQIYWGFREHRPDYANHPTFRKWRHQMAIAEVCGPSVECSRIKLVECVFEN